MDEPLSEIDMTLGLSSKLTNVFDIVTVPANKTFSQVHERSFDSLRVTFEGSFCLV